MSTYASFSFAERTLQFHLESRSIYGIIWSCLATLFACTWIAVHPNIPALRDGALRVHLRRMAIMFYLLLAPEMVILWAARQHFAAKKLAKRYRDRKWTRTHGFLLVMGGFALYNPDTNTFIGSLDSWDLDRLYASGHITWPSISEEQIQDRSKADFLAKAVVLVQTTWFIVGCIARLGNRLPLTELEVVTLAYALLNGVVYWLWWDKPMDVRCPIEVYCLTEQYPRFPGQTGEGTILLDTQCMRGQISNTPFESIPSSRSQQALQPNTIFTPSPIDHPLSFPFDRSRSPAQPPPWILQLQSEHDSLNSNAINRFLAILRQSVQKHGRLRGHVHVLLERPIRNAFRAFDDMLSLHEIHPHRRRVPTFYSPSLVDPSLRDQEARSNEGVGVDRPSTASSTSNHAADSKLPERSEDETGVTVDIDTIFGVAIAIPVVFVFGGIHVAAWHATFPTPIEQWMWRSSSISITAVPVLMGLGGYLATVLDPNDNTQSNQSEWSAGKRWWGEFLGIVGLMSASIAILIYMSSRLVLLALPFVQLRTGALDEPFFVDIDWINFFPHIG